jgi:hypothetical protein
MQPFRVNRGGGQAILDGMRAPKVARPVVLFVAASLMGPWATSVAGAADVVVPLNDCAETDNGDPVVTALDISPRTVDLRNGGRTVTVTVSAVDTGGPGPATGIRAVSVFLSSGGISSDGVSAAAVQVAPGTWRAQVRLARGTGARGTLRPFVSFQDGNGGAGSYLTSDQLAAQGFTATATVRNAGPRDVSPPDMTSFRLSTRSVDSRQHDREVVVRARWRDDLSGVRRVLVQTEVGRVRLRRVGGTPTDGSWRGVLTVGRWVGDQTAHVYVKAFDRAGVRRIYGRAALRAHGLPSSFHVRARSDLDAPRLTSETSLPSAVDLHAGDVGVPVRLHVRDADSGTTRVLAWFTTRGNSQRGGPSTVLRRVSGTPQDGWWEGTVRLTHCQAFSDRWMLAANATDLRGLTRWPVFAGQVIEVQGTDHTVELIERGTPSWTDPTRLRILFGEEMAGISPTSAVVQRHDFQPFRTVPVTAAWACADSSGSAVDCFTGPVRSATVTLDEPHVRTSAYGVLVNPEHVLDVRDLAGNAPRRLDVYLGQQEAAG